MYSREYYSNHDQGSYDSAITILSRLSAYVNPQSVIDIGCGSGTWCKAAMNVWGIVALGIDQHSYEDCNMHIPESQYLQNDIRSRVHGYHADLVICVEVIEHIDEEYEDTVLDNICAMSNTILFSGALPFQGGTGHVNEKPYSYWVEKFNRRGFYLDERIRHDIWDDARVAIWYRNNIMLLHKNTNKNRMMHQHLDIIHPHMLERILRKRGFL